MSAEKHIPIIQKTVNWVKVIVWEIEHPMTEEHFIEWIEISTKNKTLRKNLTFNDKPIAEFEIDEEIIWAKAHCNIHWTWESK